MTSDEFRRRGREVVEWIASYMERVENLPVLSQVQPGQVRSQLPPMPPELGEPFEAVMRDLDSIIVPGLTNWQSPNFFGYFPANASGPAILGELLSAGLGVQGMLWATSPACTELETHVLDWVAHMLDLPAKFLSGAGGGVIQDTASSATLCAMLAARERAGRRHEGTEARRHEGALPGLLRAFVPSCLTHSELAPAPRLLAPVTVP
jgi:aromatic-L-amino-acid decarboxylase